MNRFIRIFDEYIKLKYPNFNPLDCHINIISNKDPFFDYTFLHSNKKIYAVRYYVMDSEIMVNDQIIEDITRIFNDETEKYFLIWFNDKFNTNAKYLSLY